MTGTDTGQGVHDVFVSVGTDVHPFDRVVAWVDRWLAAHPGARVLVQYGTSSRPTLAEGDSLLPYDMVQSEMAGAGVIVTHGGPATIREALARGVRPVVVPRDPAFGEHVDDHQLRFTRMLEERGDVVRCVDEATFSATLDRAISEPGWLELKQSASGLRATEQAIARVCEILDEVMLGRSPTRG